MKKLLGLLAASMIACATLSAYGDNDDFDYDFSRANEIHITKKIQPVRLFMPICRFSYCFFVNTHKNDPFYELIRERHRWRVQKDRGIISEEIYKKRVFSEYQKSGKDLLITSIGGHWVVDVADQLRIPYGAYMLNAVRDTMIEMLMCQIAKNWCDRMWEDKYYYRFKKNKVDENEEERSNWYVVANKNDGVEYEGISDGTSYDFYKNATTYKLKIKPKFNLNVDNDKEKSTKYSYESDWGLNEYSRI